MEEQKVPARTNLKGVWINSLSPGQIVTLSTAVLLLVTLLDLKVENIDVRFTVFYFIPITLSSWRLKVTSIVTFIFAVTALWFFNYEFWRPVRFQAVDFWNLGVMASSFAFIAYIVYLARKGFEEEMEANGKLNKLINEQETLLTEVRKLQDNVLVMCAWSHRIKDEGKWISLEEFMTKHFNLKMSHGISPEELAKIQKAVENPGQFSDNPK